MNAATESPTIEPDVLAGIGEAPFELSRTSDVLEHDRRRHALRLHLETTDGWEARQMTTAMRSEPDALGTLTRSGAGEEVASLARLQRLAVAGQVIMGLAHDLNNLVTIILGHAELLRDSSALMSQNATSVEAIGDSATRAAQFTRRVLMFSRRQHAAAEPVDLAALVLGLQGVLQSAVGKRIELVLAAEPDSGRVQANAGELEQIVFNLCLNARDAMPNGGRLSVCTARRGEDHVELSVSDTGTGMDAATQAHLFEPFFTTKEADKGTGLGLAIVADVVSRAGGEIGVASELGQGTTFTILFPRAPDPVPLAAVTEPWLRGSETILVADANEPVRHMVRTFLRQYGYHVLEACTAAEAAEVVAAHGGTVHLLVADRVLPPAGGQQFAADLATEHPGLEVLFLSTLPPQEDDHAPLLQKPFNLNTLLGMVREMLDRHRPAPPLRSSAVGQDDL